MLYFFMISAILKIWEAHKLKHWCDASGGLRLRKAIGIIYHKWCLLVVRYAVCLEAAFESAVDFNRVMVAFRMRSLFRTPPVISYSRLSLPYFNATPLTKRSEVSRMVFSRVSIFAFAESMAVSIILYWSIWLRSCPVNSVKWFKLMESPKSRLESIDLNPITLCSVFYSTGEVLFLRGINAHLLLNLSF